MNTLNLPAPVRLLLLCNGTPAVALQAVHKSTKNAIGYKVHSYVRGHPDKLPQLSDVISSLREVDVMLFAPSAPSLVADSQVQLFEQDVLRAVFCQPRVVPVVLYLLDWKYAHAKHVSFHADKIEHVISTSGDKTGGAVDTFPYARFTYVPSDAPHPGTILTLLREISRPAQSCCA